MVEAKDKPNIFADLDSELPDDQLSKLFLEKILEQSVDVSDPLYKLSFPRTYKVNFNICGQTGSQLYEPTKYSFKYGEFLDDPDFKIDGIVGGTRFNRIYPGKQISQELRIFSFGCLDQALVLLLENQ